MLIPRGAPIAVIAPSGAYDPARLEQGLALARARGYDLRPFPGMLRPERYLAAPDAVRIEQLTEALTDPRYAAVWIARGGFGLTRILSLLDVDRLRPRPVVGFSDVTALFNVLHGAGLGPCIHGPVVHSLPLTDGPSLDALWRLFEGERTDLVGEPWVEGVAEGPVLGGNLCLLAATAGTPAALRARGAILVLEDVGEPAYRIDRMLTQCLEAGLFDGVRGVVLGRFVDCRVPAGATYGLEDVLRDRLEPLGVPVLADVPIGHGASNQPFVWGEIGRIEGDRLRWIG